MLLRDFVPLWWALLIPHAELSTYFSPSRAFPCIIESVSHLTWQNSRKNPETFMTKVNSRGSSLANITWKCKNQTPGVESDLSIRNMFQTFFICRTSTRASQKSIPNITNDCNSNHPPELIPETRQLNFKILSYSCIKFLIFRLGSKSINSFSLETDSPEQSPNEFRFLSFLQPWSSNVPCIASEVSGPKKIGSYYEVNFECLFFR